jgi:hypothetical protein
VISCAYCARSVTKVGLCDKHYLRTYRVQRGLVNPETHCRTCGRRTRVAPVFDGLCYPCHAEHSV